MSGVSSAELLLLLVIGLIVLGPKRLPEIASKIGGWVGQARRMTRVMKRQLEDELSMNEFNDIAQPKITRKPDPIVTPEPAADNDAADDDDAPDDDKKVADYIPNDDDSFSPLHEKDTE